MCRGCVYWFYFFGRTCFFFSSEGDCYLEIWLWCKGWHNHWGLHWICVLHSLCIGVDFSLLGCGLIGKGFWCWDWSRCHVSHCYQRRCLLLGSLIVSACSGLIHLCGFCGGFCVVWWGHWLCHCLHLSCSYSNWGIKIGPYDDGVVLWNSIYKVCDVLNISIQFIIFIAWVGVIVRH